MNPRQRLFHVLRGEPTDRTPVWLLFPYHRTSYYVDVRSHPDYRRVFDFSRDQGVIMLNRRNLGIRLHSPDVADGQDERNTESGSVHRRTMRYKGAQLVADKPLASGEPGKKLLASEEDIEAFCRFPLEENESTITSALNDRLTDYRREQSEFPPDLGAMMLDLGSPVNTLYFESNLEEYAIWSLTHDDLIVDWLERRMRQLEIVYRFCLERELADVYFLVGSELAAPPLVSRATFQKWVVPYERKLIDLVHSYGKQVIQHFHGQIQELLPDFLTMKPDGLHTIEAPPVGNCTLSQAYEGTQSRITLIGNIQYDEFRSATPSEMRQRVFETLDEVAGRRFILTPTAGPFDADPSPNLIENYYAFIKAAAEYPLGKEG